MMSHASDKLLEVAKHSGASNVGASTEVFEGIAGIFDAQCTHIQELEATVADHQKWMAALDNRMQQLSDEIRELRQ